MPTQLFQRLAAHARRRCDADAVARIDERGRIAGRITYAHLHDAVESLAADLAARRPGGSVVMLCLPNGVEYVVWYLAVLRAGLRVFPVHPSQSAAELRAAVVEASGGNGRGVAFVGAAGAMNGGEPAGVERLDAGAVRHWLTRPGPSRRTPPPLGSGDAAMLLQSSGTTGQSKLVLRRGPSLDAVASITADAVGLLPRDRVLAAIPLCHSYGVENGLLAPLWAGAAIHACHGFDPAVARRQWREAGASVLPGVPFMFEVLAGSGGSEIGGDGTGMRESAGSLRCAYSAGAPLPRAVADAFTRRFGLRVGQLYGATEIGSVAYNDPLDPSFDPAAVGAPMSGVSIAILDADAPDPDRPLPPGDQGQIAVRAPSMLSACVERGAEYEPPLLGGHFLTGDLGRVDASGALTITGRLKLLIDVGGMKVNPLEVEAALAQHPAVRECVVIPMPVSDTLVRLKAIVALNPGHDGVGADALRRHARTRLAGFKVPRVFEVRDHLPTSPTGKVQRRALMETT